MGFVGRLADRLLGVVVPKASARAYCECEKECGCYDTYYYVKCGHKFGWIFCDWVGAECQYVARCA